MTASTASADDGHLREETLASRQVYRGHFLDVRCDEVRLPNGATAQREYIVHPGAVMVIPMLDDGRLVVERQYRHPLGQVVAHFRAEQRQTSNEDSCGGHAVRVIVPVHDDFFARGDRCGDAADGSTQSRQLFRRSQIG